jgi:integrase
MCAEWWDSYFAYRESKGQTSVKDARGHVRNWILPQLSVLAMRDVTPRHLRRVVEVLDEAVSDERISAKTAANIWGDVTSAFGHACASKRDELRVRDDDPSAKVQGPEKGVTRQKPVLYPREITQLLSCEEVPLERRFVYAVASYTGARSNELAALTAASVDLENLQITIAAQRDRKTKLTKLTKTRQQRCFSLEPMLVPLLAYLVQERPTGYLLAMPPDEQRARLLREDLLTAGVARRELHAEDSKTHVPMWLHHLRDTCLVMMAVRGDDPLRIQFRAGHSTFATTQRYLAQAKNVPPNFGEPFPPLPASILPGILPGEEEPSPEMPGHSGELGWRPQRDSNPGERARSRVIWRDFARSDRVVCTR